MIRPQIPKPNPKPQTLNLRPLNPKYNPKEGQALFRDVDFLGLGKHFYQAGASGAGTVASVFRLPQYLFVNMYKHLIEIIHKAVFFGMFMAAYGLQGVIRALSHTVTIFFKSQLGTGCIMSPFGYQVL